MCVFLPQLHFVLNFIAFGGLAQATNDGEVNFREIGFVNIPDMVVFGAVLRVEDARQLLNDVA